jgi:hypothetical protein
MSNKRENIAKRTPAKRGSTKGGAKKTGKRAIKAVLSESD